MISKVVNRKKFLSRSEEEGNNNRDTCARRRKRKRGKERNFSKRANERSFKAARFNGDRNPEGIHWSCLPRANFSRAATFSRERRLRPCHVHTRPHAFALLRLCSSISPAAFLFAPLDTFPVHSQRSFAILLRSRQLLFVSVDVFVPALFICPLFVNPRDPDDPSQYEVNMRDMMHVGDTRSVNPRGKNCHCSSRRVNMLRINVHLDE